MAKIIERKIIKSGNNNKLSKPKIQRKFIANIVFRAIIIGQET